MIKIESVRSLRRQRDIPTVRVLRGEKYYMDRRRSRRLLRTQKLNSCDKSTRLFSTKYSLRSHKKNVHEKQTRGQINKTIKLKLNKENVNVQMPINLDDKSIKQENFDDKYKVYFGKRRGRRPKRRRYSFPPPKLTGATKNENDTLSITTIHDDPTPKRRNLRSNSQVISINETIKHRVAAKQKRRRKSEPILSTISTPDLTCSEVITIKDDTNQSNPTDVKKDFLIKKAKSVLRPRRSLDSSRPHKKQVTFNLKNKIYEISDTPESNLTLFTETTKQSTCNSNGEISMNKPRNSSEVTPSRHPVVYVDIPETEINITEQNVIVDVYNDSIFD